jgi:hypothetical protein
MNESAMIELLFPGDRRFNLRFRIHLGHLSQYSLPKVIIIGEVTPPRLCLNPFPNGFSIAFLAKIFH